MKGGKRWDIEMLLHLKVCEPYAVMTTKRGTDIRSVEKNAKMAFILIWVLLQSSDFRVNSTACIGSLLASFQKQKSHRYVMHVFLGGKHLLLFFVRTFSSFLSTLLLYPSWLDFGGATSLWPVMSFCLSVGRLNIKGRDGKLNFHAPIGALVFPLNTF